MSHLTIAAILSILSGGVVSAVLAVLTMEARPEPKAIPVRVSVRRPGRD